MFEFFKKVFHGKPESDDPNAGNGEVYTTESQAQVSATAAAPAAVTAQRLPPPPAGNGNGNGSPTSVEILLRSVLEALPLELKARVRQTDVGDATVSIPLEKVLNQLSLGSVKITFGELRRAAPQLFAPGTDRDQVAVALPLSDILSQINPAMLGRRPNQKQIYVPDEVRSPFGDNGNGLIFSVGPGKGEAAPAARGMTPAAPAPAAPARAVTPAAPRRPAPTPPPVQPAQPAPAAPAAPQRPAAPAAFAPRPITPVPPAAPQQPAARPAVPPPFQQRPAAPAHPVTPISPINPAPAAPISPLNPAGPITPIAPSAPARPAPTPATSFQAKPPFPTQAQPMRAPFQPISPIQPAPRPQAPAPSAPIPMSRPAAPAQVPNRAAAQPPMQAPISPIAPAVPRMPLPVPQPQPQEPMAAPAPARPAAEVPSFIIPLATVAETWAEPIRYEIGELGVQDAKLALPIDIAEQALKRGRVAFPWNVLRSWIRPAPVAVVSMHDNAMLEIPLKVLAPLFIQRQKESARVQQKVAIDENIPNLFFGFPQPAGAPAPEPPEATPLAVSKPADTNYFAWNESANEPAPEEPGFRRADGMPGTGFVTRCATPNEVVSRAAALDGVAGALIALPDGLMVASRLAPDLNGDTLAAFLPHIFGKVSQCTKELRMGELNNLNFTVGNVPWKIFRVNAIFFAAFGRAGQALPTGQLAALAAELDRKKQ